MSQPTFSIGVEPGLNLEDTVFTARGVITRPLASDYTRLGLAWLRDNYPEYLDDGRDYHKGSKHWSLLSKLGDDRLVAFVQQGKSKVTLTPVAAKHALWRNFDGEIPAHYSTELNEAITVDTSVGWSAARSETLGEEVSLGVEVEGVSAGAKADHSVTTEVGHNASTSHTVEVGSTDAVDVNVPPGKGEIAVLFVERGKLTADVELVWRPTGYIAVGLYTSVEEGVIPGKLDRLIHVPAESLAQYDLRHYGSELATITIDYVGESVISTITIDDDDPSTVSGAIDSELAKFHAKATGGGNDAAGVAVKLPRCIDDAEIRSAVAELGEIGAALRTVVEKLRAGEDRAK